MKKIFGIIILLGLLACSSETNESGTPDATGATSPALSDPLAAPSVTPLGTNPTTPPATANAVSHYLCPAGCIGGGGPAEGPCPICGKQMMHNQGFHDQQADPTLPPQPQKVDPPQNAKGVWHYNCPKGCKGGAGAAEACKSCGTVLVHNADYHAQ